MTKPKPLCRKGHRVCSSDIKSRCLVHSGKWFCQRVRGHKGHHVACCVKANLHNMDVWPQTKPAPKVGASEAKVDELVKELRRVDADCDGPWSAVIKAIARYILTHYQRKGGKK